MDNEIKYFIDFDENEKEEEKSDKLKPMSRLHKIILLILILIIFVLTTIFGFLSDNINKTEAKETDLTEMSYTNHPQISDRYKIKMFEFHKNDTVIIRGKINITKDDLKILSSKELDELFEYISSLTNYNWITISFADGTGILTLPENINLSFYGRLDDNGLISDMYGTIVKNGDADYLFIENTNSDSKVTENITNPDNGSIVYITASGTKYHFDGCSYLTESKPAVSLSKAKEQGYLPCSR